MELQPGPGMKGTYTRPADVTRLLGVLELAVERGTGST